MKCGSAVLIIGKDGGVSRAIRTLGLRPVVVERPREALTRCHELPPSLVLLNLPSSAVESRVLSALSKEGIPVLVLTDPKSSGEIGLRNGGNGKIHVLARPARDRDLRAAVQTLLGDSRKIGSRKGTPGEGNRGEQSLREDAPPSLQGGRMGTVKEIIACDPRRERKLELPPETMRLFTEYPWPGNVGELKHAILRLVVLGNVAEIHAEISDRFRALTPKGPERKDTREIYREAPDLDLLVSVGLRVLARHAAQEAEREAIREVLDRVHWNRLEAARLLKVSDKTLLSKINDCGLTPNHKRCRA